MNKIKFLKESKLSKNMLIDVSYLMHIAKYNKNVQENGFNVNMWKHLILSGIFFSKKKFNPDKVFICVDGKKSWRKRVFPNYKFKRRKSREKEDFDYKMFYAEIDDFLIELKDNFPFYIINHENAEGDDIIATFCKYNKDMCLNILISADKDFIQLNKYNNFYQYDYIRERFIESDNWKYDLFRLCVKGDSSDGIPNIKMNSDCFVKGERQKPIYEKNIKIMFDNMKTEKENIFNSDFEKDNFKRNMKLISFNYIPTELENDILNEIKNCKINGGKLNMLSYFIEHDMKELQDYLENGVIN